MAVSASDADGLLASLVPHNMTDNIDLSSHRRKPRPSKIVLEMMLLRSYKFGPSHRAVYEIQSRGLLYTSVKPLGGREGAPGVDGRWGHRSSGFQANREAFSPLAGS